VAIPALSLENLDDAQEHGGVIGLLSMSIGLEYADAELLMAPR
jgi:hypothetical protein